MGMANALKGLIERGQYLWARKFILKTLFFSDDHIKRHKGLFISTAGQSWDHVFDGAFPMITAIFDGTGIEYYDNIIANNMDEYRGIQNQPSSTERGVSQRAERFRAVLEKLKDEGLIQPVTKPSK